MSAPLIITLLIVLVLLVLPIAIYPFILKKLYSHYFQRMDVSEIEKWDLRDEQYSAHRDEIKRLKDEFQRNPHEEISVLSYDSLKLYADYYDNGSKKTVILLHGIHTIPLFNFSLVATRLYEMGYNILLIDERCHSRSEGTYIGMGVKESRDLLSWIEEIRKRYNPESIYLYGMSMGATTISLASDVLDPSIVKGMVIDCGFVSFDRLERHVMGSIGVPYFLSRAPFLWYSKLKTGEDMKHISTIDHLKNATIPALFIHGRKDRIVSVNDSIDNYNACGSKVKRLEIVESAGHTTSLHEDYDRLMPIIEEFIK